MMYFFVLGSNPGLSVAEIFSVFKYKLDYELINNNILLVDFGSKKINHNDLIYRLGGTIKIGQIIKNFQKINNNDVLEIIKNEIKPGLKFNFGFSSYNKFKVDKKKIAMEIKNYLKEKKQPVRWVISREESLSSVVVEQNKLLPDKNGLDLVFFSKDNVFFLGKTLAVQPFKDFSFRDYGRPERDDLSGMLPPKLAKIMINLSGAEKNESILDPFCGSGTIITEGLLMGYKKITGSDISKKAIGDTIKNLDWLRAKYESKNINTRDCRFFSSDCRELSERIKPKMIDAVITETYLGPQRGSFDLNKTINDLNSLYGQCFKELLKVVKKNSRIIIALPIFKSNKNLKYLSPDLHNFEIINFLPKEVLEKFSFNFSFRKTFIYGRENQKIWREIFILRVK